MHSNALNAKSCDYPMLLSVFQCNIIDDLQDNIANVSSSEKTNFTQIIENYAECVFACARRRFHSCHMCCEKKIMLFFFF